MWKYIFSFCVFVVLLTNTAIAQDDPISEIEKWLSQNPHHTVEPVKIPQYEKLHTPNSEVEDAIRFLSELYVEDAEFIRFFSTYAVPSEYREEEVLTLSFVVHSLAGLGDKVLSYNPLAVLDNGKFKAYHRVPGSDTLWWIDLRDYNWTPEAWEIISKGDGYFAEPIVRHDRSGVLRLLAGNAVVRSDWFIKHATNTVDQIDLGGKVNFYDTLVYAQIGTPKNIDEWRQVWGLKIENSRKIGNEFGTIVTKSDAVARHNRFLFGYRTEHGYMYETYDVSHQVGKRDYIESFFLNENPGAPPDVSDAGEAFSTNSLQLQVYALRDAAGNLIHFADPGVARHMQDVLRDARVRTSFSCMDCHAAGPIPAENTLSEFVDSQMKLKVYLKEDADRIKRSLLDDRFEDSIKENQTIFKRALFKVNGCEPAENGINYLQSITRYAKPVTVEVAAKECGVTVEHFVKAVKEKSYRYGARLKLLVTTGEPIPRDVWESPGKDGIPGSFQQAMIILNGLTIVEESIDIDRIIEKIDEVDPFKADLIEEQTLESQVLQVLYRSPLKVSNDIIAWTKPGDKLLILDSLEFHGGKWYFVRSRLGYEGYINQRNVAKILMDAEEQKSYFKPKE